jgi:hypothetical protein
MVVLGSVRSSSLVFFRSKRRGTSRRVVKKSRYNAMLNGGAWQERIKIDAKETAMMETRRPRACFCMVWW